MRAKTLPGHGLLVRGALTRSPWPGVDSRVTVMPLGYSSCTPFCYSLLEITVAVKTKSSGKIEFFSATGNIVS